MKHRLLGVLIGLVTTLVVTVSVLAASYSAPLVLTESLGTDYDMLAANVTMDIDGLADLGMLSTTGLDTRILYGTSELPHLLTEDKALFVLPVAGNTQYPLTFTTGNDALSYFDIITGPGGYVTVPFATPSDDFEWGADTDSLATSGGDITWSVTVAGTSVADIDTAQKYAGTRSGRLYRDGTNNVNAYFAQDAVSGAEGISFRFRKDDTSQFYFQHGNGTKLIWFAVMDDEDLEYVDDPTFYDTGTDVSISTWHQIDVRNVDWVAGTYDIYVDAVLAQSGAVMSTSSSYEDYIYLWNVTGTSEVWIDNIGIQSFVLGDDWSITFDDVYIDTDAGASKYILYVSANFYLTVDTSTSGTITAHIADTSVIYNETLSVDGPGSYTQWDGVTGAATHWEAVDDTPGAPDESTYIWEDDNSAHHDSFSLTDPTSIESDDVVSYVRQYNYVKGWQSYGSSFWPTLVLNGSVTTGTLHSHALSTWELSSEVLARPGGGSWQVADLTALQAGMKDSTSATNYCSQVYVIYYYYDGADVTVTDVSTGVHDITLSLSDSTLSLTVDTSTDTSTFNSRAPDSDDDWVFFENDVFVYSGEIEVTVDGTVAATYAPSSMIVGTTLLDETGGNDGTITWGANPAGIDITVGALLPDTSSQATASTTSDSSSFVPETGDSDMTTTGTEGEGLPFYGLIKGLLSEYHAQGGPDIPMSTFWKIVAVVFGWCFGTGVMIISRNVVFGFIGYILGFAIPAYAMSGMLDAWIPVVYGVAALCLMGLIWKWSSSSIG